MTDQQLFAEILRSLGRMEGTLERVVEDIKANNDNHTKADAEMDDRLRKVENRQYWHAGAASIVGAVGGFLLTVISHFKATFGS